MTIIIVEGPDGSGKTTLVQHLQEVSRFQPITRTHTDSINGPIDELYQWTKRDIWNWPHREMAIYDRHPIIGEYIYGPALRGGVKPGFDTPEAEVLRLYAHTQAHVIICLPSLSVIRHNLAVSVMASEDGTIQSAQMPGVTEHISQIYHRYLQIYYNLKAFGGARVTKFDYTKGFMGYEQ